MPSASGVDERTWTCQSDLAPHRRLVVLLTAIGRGGSDKVEGEVIRGDTSPSST